MKIECIALILFGITFLNMWSLVRVAGMADRTLEEITSSQTASERGGENVE